MSAAEWADAGGGSCILLSMSPDEDLGEGKPRLRVEAGLCADCVHGRRVASERGSVFLLCELALTDKRFEKYPRLPVLRCVGYERKTRG